jgi:hypothetical protein
MVSGGEASVIVTAIEAASVAASAGVLRAQAAVSAAVPPVAQVSRQVRPAVPVWALRHGQVAALSAAGLRAATADKTSPAKLTRAATAFLRRHRSRGTIR